MKWWPAANDWRFVRAARCGLSSNYSDHLLLLLLQAQDEMTMTYQAASSSSSSATAAAAANVCYRYAIVRDVATQTDIDVCSSTERVSHAYSSVGSTLEIRLFRQRLPANQSSGYSSPQAAARRFLIQYTGTPSSIIAQSYHRYSHHKVD